MLQRTRTQSKLDSLYRQAEEFGNSYSHYYTRIDDVYVRRNVVEHDVVVLELILANNQDMNVFGRFGNIPQFLLGLAEGSCEGGLDVAFYLQKCQVTTELEFKFVVSIRRCIWRRV